MYEALQALESDLNKLRTDNPDDHNIQGIGCDLVSIDRMQALFAKHQEQLVKRILSTSEHEVWYEKRQKLSDQQMVSYLAKRWAAKEAVVKAIGLGFRQNISWREISILNDGLGKPYVEFIGKTKAFINEWQAEKNAINHCFISLTDEKHHAMAFCVFASNSTASVETDDCN